MATRKAPRYLSEQPVVARWSNGGVHEGPGIEAAREALPAIRALLAGETPRSVAAEYVPRLVTDPGLA